MFKSKSAPAAPAQPSATPTGDAAAAQRLTGTPTATAGGATATAPTAPPSSGQAAAPAPGAPASNGAAAAPPAAGARPATPPTGATKPATPAGTKGPGPVQRATSNARNIFLLIIGALIALFAVFNSQNVQVHWVFGHAVNSPLILVIVVAFVAGGLVGWLAAIRGSRRRSS